MLHAFKLWVDAVSDMFIVTVPPNDSLKLRWSGMAAGGPHHAEGA